MSIELFPQTRQRSEVSCADWPVFQELIEDRMRLLARMDARERLRESEKTLSQNIYERGVDDAGFGRIRSKGDAALFGGHTTQVMKDRYGITKTRPLADFLPTHLPDRLRPSIHNFPPDHAPPSILVFFPIPESLPKRSLCLGKTVLPDVK